MASFRDTGDKKYYRVLNILNRLNGGKVNCSELAREFNVSMRSIQRDLERINLTGFSLISEKKGEYSFAPGVSLKELKLSGPQVSLIVMMRDMVSAMGGQVMEAFNSVFSRITDLNESNSIILAINSKNLTSFTKHIYDEISYAVEYSKLIKLSYSGNCGLKEFILKPLKILTSDTFFYLLALPTKKDALLKFRIDKIKDIEVMDEDFSITLSEETLDIIKNATSIWGINSTPTKKIKLSAKGSAADFFSCKHILPHQKISKSRKDGSIEIQALISNYMEVIPIILQWIPEIRVISPEDLRSSINSKVKGYLELTCNS